MRRLLVAAGLLVFIFAATLWNNTYLEDFTGDLSALLTRAEAAAQFGDWETTAALTDEALARWTARDGYLHVLLRHGDTDEIYTAFHEVQRRIAVEDEEDYPAANARLLVGLQLLYEAEQLTLKNVL